MGCLKSADCHPSNRGSDNPSNACSDSRSSCCSGLGWTTRESRLIAGQAGFWVVHRPPRLYSPVGGLFHVGRAGARVCGGVRVPAHTGPDFLILYGPVCLEPESTVSPTSALLMPMTGAVPGRCRCGLPVPRSRMARAASVGGGAHG